MAVTPIPALTTTVATGGTPVTVFAAFPNGGFIQNPYSAVDQNIGGGTELLYVNPLGAATLQGNGSTFALQPGETWTVIPGQATTTTVNATTNGHQFAAVSW